jgi:hypothetical protein
MQVAARRGLPSAWRWAAAVLATAAIVVAFLVALGSAPQRAEAYSTANFCPNSTSLVWLTAGTRCVDGRRVRHRYIQANIVYFEGNGEYCVGAKQNPDGTGANTKGFGCSIPSLTNYTYSGAQGPPGSDLGYATIINNTGGSATFAGYMEYYP